jgi:ABC-2 type transport system ATP-binding protein
MRIKEIAMDCIIETRHLTKTYPGFTLDAVNLRVPYGRIVGLVGENGAGKTTLISLILNQIKRDSGCVRVFGKDNIEEEREIKQEIGFFVEQSGFHDCLNAKDINGIMKHVYKKWDEAHFERLLTKLDVETSKKVKDMSKGMKSKLMLAVAMSHKPALLILDEVTSGLDPVVRDDILKLLKEYVSGKKTTVFFSTHITSDLDKIADDVAFLHEGRLVFYEPIDKLHHEYALIRCSPDNFNTIDPKDVIMSYQDGDKHFVLTHRNSKYADDTGEISIPAIDDIMLLYIRGGNGNEGID